MKVSVHAVCIAILCLTVGQCLDCYECNAVMCRFPSEVQKVTCAQNSVCDTRVISCGGSKMNLGKACIEESKCSSTDEGSVWGWHSLDFMVTHSCCYLDLCNCAPCMMLALIPCLSPLLFLLLVIGC